MLKANHIQLAPLTPGDSPKMFKWINDRSLVLCSASYRPITRAQHNAWFESIRKRNDVCLFGIRLVRSGKLIGSCQLHSVSPVHRTAELQIRIGEQDKLRRGYGTEALRLLLKFAFHDLNLHRVYLHVFERNVPAIRTYEKIGFMREGLLRSAAHIDGKYVNVVVMGILQNEFRG